MSAQDHADRFWSKVAIAGSDECWEWRAATFRGGYGKFGIGPRGPSRDRYAHRVAYELVVGEISPGYQLDHLCRNAGCVNPAHLEPVTGRENTLRGVSFAAINAKKTRCDRGHDLAGDVYIWRGRRVCRECRRITAGIRRGISA